MSTALPNPYPSGPRFLHNTQRKDVNNLPPTPAPTPAPVVAEQGFSTVYITDEARHIARHLGIRASAALVQRVLNAESAVAALTARVEQLEKQNRAPHLSKVEKRSA